MPKLVQKTREFHAGGMAAPVDIPMGSLEKLECEFTLSAFDRAVLGLQNGMPGVVTQLTARGALASDNGVQVPLVVQMHGVLRELDLGTWKVGDDNNLKVVASLRYFKLVHAGKDVVEVDAINLVWKVNGVDQLAATRAALGL
jgi:P2 family phage contractile tail tube protein